MLFYVKWQSLGVEQLPRKGFRDQVLNVMRYHVYKTSQNRHLLLGDSQVKRLDFSNINILSLPGAGCHQAYAFKPPEGKYDTISLFIGGNDLYNGYVPSKKSVETVIDNICELANNFCERTERVYVFGIPPRFPPDRELEEFKARYDDHELFRYFAVNKKLSELSYNANWIFRGISDAVWSSAQISDNDNVHLNEQAHTYLRRILKNRVLYSSYSAGLSSKTNPQIIECSQESGCVCGYFS